MFDSCSVADMLLENPSASDGPAYMEGSSHYQIKSVISVVNHRNSLIVAENTFSGNLGFKGPIFIEMGKEKGIKSMFTMILRECASRTRKHIFAKLWSFRNQRAQRA